MTFDRPNRSHPLLLQCLLLAFDQHLPDSGYMGRLQGDRLRDARKAAGKTQDDIAAELGITRTAYLVYEQGRIPKGRLAELRRMFDLDENLLPCREAARSAVKRPDELDSLELMVRLSRAQSELNSLIAEVTRRLAEGLMNPQVVVEGLQSPLTPQHAHEDPGATHYHSPNLNRNQPDSLIRTNGVD